MTKLINVKGYVLLAMALFLIVKGYSQGLPPGWEYAPTPVTHIVSIKLSANPNINGFPLNPGDYIGAFYLDENNAYKCGGAVEWLGDQNTGIIIFGDDNFTTQKDGFSSGELINWKVFSWSVQKTYDAEVTCDPALPSSCTNFVGQGLAGLASFDASGYFLVISAVPDNICQGDMVQLTANPSGGSGNYSFSWSSVPVGFSSNSASPQVYPQVSTQYLVQVTDGVEMISLDLFVEVTSLPYVSTGSDQIVCEDQNVILNGILANGTNPLWSSSGDGTFLETTALTTQYFPGINDVLGGAVILSLTAQPILPCILTVSDQMNVIIQYLPEVFAGTDQSICENEDVILIPDISYFGSISWVTSGDGFFENPTIPETTYTPGEGDKLTGFVTLTIILNPIAPCVDQVSDFLLVEFELLSSAYVGEDMAICQNDFAELSATAINYSTIQWTTSGDGSFDNSGSLNSVYYPGVNDIMNGDVNLIMNSFPFSPCDLISSDTLSLSIIKLPIVSAGPDVTICNGMIHQVTASASDYDELLWITSGDGTFEDQNALMTNYYPGELDLTLGSAQLTILVLPQFPCLQSTQDFLQLSFQPPPTVDAGQDATIHSDETHQLSGFASEFESIIWSTSGDGTFNDLQIFDPVYSPGTNDILLGSTKLFLTAFPISPCNLSSIDSLLVTIDSFTLIKDSYHNIHFLVYPNPSIDFLNISLTGIREKDFHIRLIDYSGRTIKEMFVNSSCFSAKDTFTIDIRDLVNGFYLLELNRKNEHFIYKILIQH